MKCFECGGESNRGQNIEYVGAGGEVRTRFVCASCEEEISEMVNAANAAAALTEPETCEVCGEPDRTVVIDADDHAVCATCRPVWERYGKAEGK